ncbi:hypothetical protein ACFQL8_20900 [Streptomyces goshikiensis]|nr:hypothetical protein [Streptomyces goshikiensis]
MPWSVVELSWLATPACQRLESAATSISAVPAGTLAGLSTGAAAAA